MTDAATNVIERSEYEPYGKLLNRPVTDGPGFTGHVQDADSGLTYMQQRYYDSTGLFTSVDQVTAYDGEMRHFNRYAYAYGNPYTYSDPDGRAGQVVAGGVIGGLIGGGLELSKQVSSGKGINPRAIAVEAGRGALIGMATSVAGPAGFAAARDAQASTAAAVAVEGAAAGMTAGYATLATGPAADVLKGQPAQSLASHGPSAAGAMLGTITGGLAGKAVSGALSRASGQASVVVGGAARAVEESTSVAVSSVAEPEREKVDKVR